MTRPTIFKISTLIVLAGVMACSSPPAQSGTGTAKKPGLKIELTPEQQAQIQQASGRKLVVVELRPETLEQRVAPGVHVAN